MSIITSHVLPLVVLDMQNEFLYPYDMYMVIVPYLSHDI